jgi:hypothetical protein
MPTLLRVERILAQLTLTADTSGEVDMIHLERSSNGIDWQSISSVGSRGGTVVDSTLRCNSPYSYRVRIYRQHDAEFSPPSDVVLVFTTACPTPAIHTVGVFKNGLWLFSDVNDTSLPDIMVQFGPNESGWTALTGDWDGDG